MTKRRTKLGQILKLLIIVYISIGILLYLLQDLFLFHGKPLPRNHTFSFVQPFQELNVPVGDRNLNIVKFGTGATKKGIVLYFHGNMRNIERYASYAKTFTKARYELWMMDYPGFGKSTGKLTEEILYRDAALMYGMAREEVAAGEIIIYGKSLGTGIAAQLASTQICRQLILETPYYSVPTIAQNKFPILPARWLVKYHFPTYSFLPNVKAPVVMFHGTHDEVISYKQALKLKKENSAATLITLENGKHNNLSQFPLFQKTLDSLLGR